MAGIVLTYAILARIGIRAIARKHAICAEQQREMEESGRFFSAIRFKTKHKREKKIPYHLMRLT